MAFRLDPFESEGYAFVQRRSLKKVKTLTERQSLSAQVTA